MPFPEQIGTSLLLANQAVIHGSTVTFTNYIVKSSSDGNTEPDMEDVDDAAGARTTRVIYKRDNKWSGVLICKAAATPLVDFAPGRMCTFTGLTSYFVDSMVINKTRGPQEVSLELTNIGIT
jgi:hypothetical protein